MHIARRSFVFLALGLALVARNATAAVIGGQRRRLYPLTALAPFLDVLIPRDETGSATDLDLDHRLLAMARTSPQHMGLLRAGCQWLDTAARDAGAAGFADLDSSRQEEIVARMAQSPPGRRPRAFFETVRRDSLTAYYADPTSWQPLGYRGPPQPEGYPHHAEPPR